MVFRKQNPFHIAVLLLFLSALACQLPQANGNSPTSIPSTIQVISTSTDKPATFHPISTVKPINHPTSLPPPAEHRIGTRRVYGIAGFFDRQTSTDFTPRGVNYAIIVPILDHYEDRLFAVGFYDHNRVSADFATISTLGYNSVRIALDGCTTGDGCIGLPDGQGLNQAYLDNIADLMKLAKESDLFLLFTLDQLPDLGGYAAIARKAENQGIASGHNVEILTTQGIQAAQQFWKDLLEGLIIRQAPMEIVLGWELIAEQYYRSDQAPFSKNSGTVKPANGQTYNLSSPVRKKALAVDGIKYYIDQVRQIIISYDPTALVTMGFLAPDTPNVWREDDLRYIETASLLKDSSLDFYDLHADPGLGLSILEIAQNFGLNGHITKPVLMGEVGASTWLYPQISDGVIAVQDWIAASCKYGFSGWIYNGYYPLPAGLADATWGAVDVRNTILDALSPKNQRDACQSTVLPGRNLALGKPVSVSGSLPDQTPQMAVDGDPNTQWSSGGFPEQRIEIDLGAAYPVGEIRLTVGMWPSGKVVHQLWVGPSLDQMKQVDEFSGQEYDFDVLSFIPQLAIDPIRYVRVVTTESPSWVSWREIEILAPEANSPAQGSQGQATQAP